MSRSWRRGARSRATRRSWTASFVPVRHAPRSNAGQEALPMCARVVRHHLARLILIIVVVGALGAITLGAALDATSGAQAGGKTATVTVGGIQVTKVVAPKD